MARNIKTYFVDGTRDIIMDGRAMAVHVIARERDFTHARIAGFATTVRDARLFAASADLLGFAESYYAMTQAVTAKGATARPTFAQLNALLDKGMKALAKANAP